MAEKPVYWDVHQCAWVGVAPTDLERPVLEPLAAETSPDAEAAVPEQRPGIDAPLAAGTPD